MGSISIIKEIHKEGLLRALLFNNGVIEIIWDESIEIVDVFQLQQSQQAVLELGKGKRMPLLFSVHDYLTTSPEANKYAVSEEGTKYTSKVAVLIDNLAKKLMMNFFMKLNKPEIPTKGFTEKDEAMEWLVTTE